MRLLQVFEPPMCCSTGVCGTEVDPLLVQFAADLEALGESGVKVERFNLSQSPSQFATTPAILALLRKQGTDALPAILVNGRLVHQGSYPDKVMLAAMAAQATPTQRPAPSSVIERARAALEVGRNVFLCVGNGGGDKFIEPFRSLAQNPAFEQTVDLIEMTGETEEERALMTEVGLPDGGQAAAVLIVPPGYITAQWAGSADPDDILLRLLQASSRCAPGGGCCS